MKLNRIEFLLMNNPVRAFVQERHEVRVWLEMADLGPVDHALEIGCGNGHGTRLIKKYFAPAFIHAIDMDERMIRIARRKNHDSTVRFEVMDAARLSFADDAFDAVFDFGIIHHLPDWADCIREMHRVLKPGGRLILEELSTDTFRTLPGRFWKRILAHPYEQMFSTADFVKELRFSGFKIEGFRELYPFRLFKHFSLVAVKESNKEFTSLKPAVPKSKNRVSIK